MDNKIASIISKSSFTVKDGAYIYAKVSSVKDIGQHFMISKDENEVTVVTNKVNEPLLDIIEKNQEEYSLISLNISVPFYAVGFLATVSGAIAEKGLNILIISTYSKDYILTKVNELDNVKQILFDLGFNEIELIIDKMDN